MLQPDLELAMQAAREAGIQTLEYFGGQYEIEDKGGGDPLTTADLAANAAFQNGSARPALTTAGRLKKPLTIKRACLARRRGSSTPLMARASSLKAFRSMWSALRYVIVEYPP